MKEPKSNLDLSLKTENDFNTRSNISKLSSYNKEIKLNERAFTNLFDSKSLSNSITSNLILTQNNNTFSSSDLQINNKEILNDVNYNLNKLDININNDLKISNFSNSKNNYSSDLKKLVYHKKSVSNFSNVINTKRIKDSINNNISNGNDNKLNENNNITFLSNKEIIKKIKHNEKISEFNDLTLTEYLKEQVNKIKNNSNRISLLSNSKKEIINNNINNTLEETKLNTSESNNYQVNLNYNSYKNISKEKNNSKYKNMQINKIVNNNNKAFSKNNYITYNNYINNSKNKIVNKKNKKEEEKINYIKICPNKNNNIKKNTFLRNSTNNGRIRDFNFHNNFTLKQFSFTNNSPNKFKFRKINSSKKHNISISSNDEINQNDKDKNDKKKILRHNYSFDKYISYININENSARSVYKNRKQKPNKLVNLKNKKEKITFNVQIDLTKLINENSFYKNKPKKSFKFSKSSRKIINNNININNFNKDFYIIPRPKINYENSNNI